MKRFLAVLFLLVGGLVANAQTNQLLAPKDFQKIAGNTKVQLLDVRTPGEFAEGHIKGAQNIDFRNQAAFNQGLAKLDKKKPVAVYCRSGHRSGGAAQVLIQQGFTVYDLRGGTIAWQAQSLPLVK